MYEVLSMKYGVLPARLFDAGNIAFKRLFAETDAAEAEITHKAAWAAALEAAAYHPGREFRGALRLHDH